MAQLRGIAPYPWGALERVPRGVARRVGTVRRRIERSGALSHLGGALGELLSSEVTVVLRDVALSAEPPAHACRVALQLEDGSAQLVIGLEPALATAMLARLLGRSVGVGPPSAPLDATLSGALAALIVEAARRGGGDVPLQMTRAALPIRAPALTVAATVLLDGKPYAASAQIWSKLPEGERSTTSAAAGELPIALGLVVALAAVDRTELAELGPGDAWLPADGWWIDRQLSGRGVLAAPGGDWGVDVEVSRDGSLVVRGVEHSLPVEVETMADDVGQAAARAALDAPVVVRVEVGAVSMTAREWSNLAPGDVIETGRRIAEPVVLRVAGRVVARGELVDVDGELGVRIRELVAGGQDA